MNQRRLLQLLVFALLASFPVVAFANCDDGGSDSGRFAEILAKHGALAAIVMSFGFGFLASLTPCVYPMVPITVSIFGATGGQTTRLRGAALSATFVLGIATLFTPILPTFLTNLRGRLLRYERRGDQDRRRHHSSQGKAKFQHVVTP